MSELNLKYINDISDNKLIIGCQIQIYIKTVKMQKQLNEQLNSMMQSVSKNIGQYDLTPEPLYVGQYSQIFHIRNRQDKKSHVCMPITKVLKVIPKRLIKKSQSEIKKLYSREKKIHQGLKNRYIIQLLNAFHDQNSHFLVMEYCSNGNLRGKMNSSMTIEQVRDYGLQIAKAISYLHKNKITHGDLIPENILVNYDNQIKICDFGQSSKFQQRVKQKCCGTFLYAPPQAIEMFDHYRDIWAFACILYEMFTGSHPFPVKSWKELSIKLNEECLKKFKYDHTMSPAFTQLMKKIFVYDKNSRLNIQQVISHPFFTNQPLQMSVASEKCQEKVVSKRSVQKSKGNFKSVQLTQRNKENNLNFVNQSKNAQNKAPDYKKILDKKFKQHLSKQISRQPSGDKQKRNTFNGEHLFQEFKKMKNTKGLSTTTNLNYNVQKKTFQSLKQLSLEPLNTEGLIIKQIIKNNNRIIIDGNGFKRFNDSNQMHVSCDGRLITFKKNQAEKRYTLQQLPEKYHQKYEQCKKIVNQAKSCSPKMTYRAKQYELNIMYDGSMTIKFRDGRILKAENLSTLSNLKDVSQSQLLLMRNLYSFYQNLGSLKVQ